jgi:3D (Asp-Asp-Asp) domain-containing protein
MAVPWNLVHQLPNMANLPRSLTLSFIGQDQGFKYSMVGGAGTTGMGNTSGVGFDLQIKNKSGIKITVGVDGLPIPILDSELQSISVSPYDTVEILDTTGATAPNEVDVFLMGLQMQDIINYTNTQPNFAVWG